MLLGLPVVPIRNCGKTEIAKEYIALEQTIFHDIPRDLLGLLLDREGSPGAMSPRTLMGTSHEVSKHQLAELYAGGFVQLPQGDTAASTPEFALAAGVLLNPLTNITFRLWSDEAVCAETCVLFPGDPIEDGGVILNQVENCYRLVSPVSHKDAIDLVAPVIPPVGDQAPAFAFEGNFDGSVAAVLFGLVDLTRSHAESDGALPGFTVSQISAALHGAWGISGFKHLISYVMVMGLLPTPPSYQEVAISLERLVDAKVVIKDESDRFTLAPSLEPLVWQLPGLVPGLQWQRHSLTDDQDVLTSHRVFIFGENHLVLTFSPMPQGRVYVASTTAAALTEFIVGEMAIVLPRAAVLQEQTKMVETTATVQCLACEAVVEVSHKFCTQCGAVRCPQCQNYVKKSKFCRSCGQKL